LDLETLQSKNKRHVVQARQLAMFFLLNLPKHLLKAHKLRQDHATVLHACKTVDNLVATDKQFKKFVEDINKN
jgi:chromosomal replication initiator protein